MHKLVEISVDTLANMYKKWAFLDKLNHIAR